MSEERFEKRLLCQLTRQEVHDYGKEVASLHMDVKELEDQRKELAEQVKPKKERIQHLAEAIDREQEYRRVDCQWDYDWSRGMKHLVRLDTMEIVETKQIQPQDRQGELLSASTHMEAN